MYPKQEGADHEALLTIQNNHQHSFHQHDMAGPAELNLGPSQADEGSPARAAGAPWKRNANTSFASAIKDYLNATFQHQAAQNRSLSSGGTV